MHLQFSQKPTVISLFPQLVEEPTHIKGNILVFVPTNSEESITDFSVHSPKDRPIGNNCFTISILLLTPKQEPKVVLDYPKAYLVGLCNYMCW